MSKFKNLKKYIFGDGEDESNRNQFMKKKQNIIGIIVLVLLALSILGLHSLSKSKKTALPKAKEEKVTSVDGVLSTDFTQKNELSALEQQQAQMDDLKNEFKSLANRQTEQKKSGAEQKEAIAKQVNAILKNREKGVYAQKMNSHRPVKPASAKPSPETHEEIIHERALPAPMHQLETIRFNYPHKDPKSGGYNGSSRPIYEAKNESSRNHKKTPKNYVPAGTFAKTVLLEGADANASVNAQSDTSGILVRVLDSGTLPNGHHSHLKGCFILASIYGDISSERGEARLTKISCTRSDGSIFEKKVQGYLSFAGKEGIKGTPVMRNGKVLMMAGISGMLSGVGSALQQASQTQSISPLGVTNTVSANKVWQNGAYGGANTAMSQMAGYYIKRADQYHPIIEIGSGTIATVIFQSGFSLLDKEDENNQSHTGPYRSTNRFSSHNDGHSSDSAQEVRRLLKQAQHLSNSPHPQASSNDSPFSNVN